MKQLKIVLCMMVVMLLAGSVAFAHHMEGTVYCDNNTSGVIDEGDTILEGVCVNVVDTDGVLTPVNRTDCTDSSGEYYISLPSERPRAYNATLISGLPTNTTFIDPDMNLHSFVVTEVHRDEIFDWLIDAPICHDDDEEGKCWMTAGGVKFDPVADMLMAQVDGSNGNGPRDSVGGVVYPSCDPDPGNGGNWNHVFHKAKWHLKGPDITVIRCGNVEGIEPGTESPVCPLNFIEFEGTGTLTGIGGNKDEYSVHFFARIEDRNEPGNEQANTDGEDIDRYFLNVYLDPMDPEGTSLLVVDMDGDPATVDPITITGGNFQIHCTSCDN